MKKIKLHLQKRSYEILIGAGTLKHLGPAIKKLKLGQRAVVVTNPQINQLHGKALKAALDSCAIETYFLEVPNAEESKSAKQCLALIERFVQIDQGKGLFVIAFGGGVIGDLAGFCASIYRRGTSFIQVPTTLLAQVDSSIGGKTAIDLDAGKNLIGSFYQPRLVLSELDILDSLKPKQISEALAEIIKYALIKDARLFSYLEDNIEAILKLNKNCLQYTIEACSRIKAKIVEQDELDKKDKRIILNFGHTTGHALEAAAGYNPDYSHGNAIALGMLVAGNISQQLRLCPKSLSERLETLLKKAGLPTIISQLSLDKILKSQAHDKKFTRGKNRFVLPVRIGKVVVKEGVPEEIIVRAIKSRMES